MPVGIAYAVWAGAGIALIALIGWAVFGQALDMPAAVDIALIVAGIVMLQLYSESVKRVGYTGGERFDNARPQH